MKRDAEAEAADLRLSASGRNGHSQQVNSPTITTTTTDVCGSTSDPVKGGETERGIQNDGEFNLEDEENLKSKGTVPVINGSEGSKDLLQDQTDQKDTYINNNDETTGHDHRDDNYITEGDELKEADHVETQNKRVPFWRKLIAYRPWNSKRSSSDLERKGICGDSCCCFRVKAKPEKELGIQDEENRKSKGTLPVINWSAGSKDSIQDETKSDTYISNYDETTGHERDELKEADLETGNKRVPATFGKQTSKQLRSSHKRRRSLESKERELGDDNHITKGDELKVVLDHLETENKRVPSSSDLEVLSITDHELNMMYDLSCSAAPSTGIRIRSRTSFREPNPALPAPCRLLGEPQVHSLPAPWRTPGALLAGSLENPRCTPCRLPAGSSLSINIPCNFNPGEPNAIFNSWEPFLSFSCDDDDDEEVEACSARSRWREPNPGQKKYGGGGDCGIVGEWHGAGDFGGGGGGGGGGGDGGGNGGGGDYGRFEPNPGIKRPTVTVSRPPPPPPPPPTL